MLFRPRVCGSLTNLTTVLPKTTSNTSRTVLTFLLVYLFLFFVAQNRCFRDPTSAFFQPSRAFAPAYSTVRLDQAERYLQNASDREKHSPPSKDEKRPTTCVCIATVARKGARYFKDAVGSVLDGLSESERADIHLVLFIAHTDPSQHPAYEEPWLRKVPDQLLLYDNATVDIEHIRSLETDAARQYAREKPLFDYTYLLKSCAAVNVPYVVMLEDDILAMDGWYHRTRQALASAEQQTAAKGASNCEPVIPPSYILV